MFIVFLPFFQLTGRKICSNTLSVDWMGINLDSLMSVCLDEDEAIKLISSNW